jgi:GNAT superfamily N-acetyltransferase
MAILPEALARARLDLSLYDGSTRIRDAVGDGRGFDAQFIRELRNAVRQNLTRTSDALSAEQQRVWWESSERDRRRVTIAECWSMADNRPHTQVIGFGMVSAIGSEGWLTGALVEGSRGHGHGMTVFEEMIAWCRVSNLQPRLEVFADNVPARRLYTALGFAINNTKLVLQPDVGPRTILTMWKP